MHVADRIPSSFNPAASFSAGYLVRRSESIPGAPPAIQLLPSTFPLSVGIVTRCCTNLSTSFPAFLTYVCRQFVQYLDLQKYNTCPQQP
ncbi:hypothetical protein PGTUg99_037225 [Puccinia graminis f. sp. tritici]|uniref:Uncharacterized protein n=1 Tax=Puccinia graminis f. sp. tritici TaxID=56615 RepID=A0A5B0RAM8_PUCGR|nr:hypothetical protein PGTUg99_037225 [Puccinia graminis f. sp. tritici]